MPALVPGGAERLIWEIEPLLLDAKYKVATSSSAMVYRDAIPDTILGYLEHDIKQIIPTLMARTDLAFQPTASMGFVDTMVDAGNVIRIDSGLSFKVRYMLTSSGYADLALRKEIVNNTKTIILETLDNPTISMGKLTARLMEGGGDHIVSVNIDNPIKGYDVATLLDDNAQFSIKTQLVALSNGTLDILDAVEVTFTTV